MNAISHNATPPTPAIAPGREAVDPRRVAEQLAERWGGGGIDPRVRAIVPGGGFDAPFFQAGLAGYSDAAMRLIARREGCPFCVTEALLDRTLLAGGRGFAKADLGDLHDNVPGGAEDHPLACQIMGSDPREMAAAALKAAEQGRRGDKAYRMMAYGGMSAEELAEVEATHLRVPGGVQVGRIRTHAGEGVELDPTEGCGDDTNDAGVLWSEDETCETLVEEINEIGGTRDSATGNRARLAASGAPAQNAAHTSLAFEVIDVNLACPVKKVRSKARGGHWLAEPAGAIRILEAVREAVPAEVPCTVKMRRSYDDTPEMAAAFETILDAAFDMGYAWATVHARTVEQKYVGPSRWDILRDVVRRRPDRLIFGSGDVWSAADIFAMIGYTGVSAVSVARGCIGNPWIFRQARDLLAGREPAPPTLTEQSRVLQDHFSLCVRVNGPRLAGRLMRKFAIKFSHHHPRAEEVKREFVRVNTTEEWGEVLARHYTG